MKKLISILLLGCIFVANALAWEVKSLKDPMTDAEKRFSRLQSKNAISLNSPYEGITKGYLYVREVSESSPSVYFVVDRGQLICNANIRCKLTVRFDQQSPIEFNGSEPVDNSSNVIFIDLQDKFIENALDAKRILIKAEFFQNGAFIFEFETPNNLSLNNYAVESSPYQSCYNVTPEIPKVREGLEDYQKRLVDWYSSNIERPENINGPAIAHIQVVAPTDGKLKDIRLAKSSGSASWDLAVIKAIRNKTCTPILLDQSTPQVVDLYFSAN